MEEKIKIIICGGGTGGHIFPAIAIANAIKELCPSADLLFVGALGKMEMQRVPDAGYPIKGLPIMGFNRKKLWKNIKVLYLLFKSQRLARKIIKEFNPDVAVGVGGYASGPTLNMASKIGLPILIQEQNSYAGITNKILGKKADLICVAYPNMERFFPKEKIILTGNPVRQSLLKHITKNDALERLNLKKDKKTVLIVGGSLGAQSINESVAAQLDLIRTHSEVQFIWQTGKLYFERIVKLLEETTPIPNLQIKSFIKEMEIAYAASDLIISRAGAGSISEFCLLRKAVILVPSPNVAEDHQTKNAMALVEKKAALYVQDSKAEKELIPTAIKSIMNDKLLNELRTNIATLALSDSATIIAKEVLKLAHKQN
ncbi:MAG: undecaprenyldiphospho-muramoylpentapeptide beta-N-acetylglucosaminyltransferase [Clostridiales bacterium]|nr:undecaprenyldiphospho-muramoylpentapeptide beta-N-acetylglucosaminyltransferase [Clostridiales bacterium]